MKPNNYDCFFVCFVVLASVFNILLAQNISLSPDEGTHLTLSLFYKDLAANSWNLGFDINRMYEFSTNYLIHYPKLTITYLPMYHLSVALMFSFGLDPIMGRLVSVIYFVLTSAMIYLISIKFLKSRKAGIFSVLLFSLTPTVFDYISKASMDYTAYFFGFLSIFLFLKAMETERKKYYVLSGIASFLVFFSRIFAVFPLLAMVSFVLLFGKKGRIKKLLLVVIPFMVLFVPFAFLYERIGGLEVNQFIIKEAEQMPWVQYNLLAPFYYFFSYGTQTYGLGIIVFLFAFFCLHREIKAGKNMDRNLFFVLWFTFAYIILTYFQNTRYVSYLLMPLIFPAGYYFSRIKIRYAAPFFMILLVIVGWNSYQEAVSTQGFAHAEKEISAYLFSKGGNIGILSEEPVFSSVFIYYMSSSDLNKTVSVYRPCFFYNFLNTSREALVEEMGANGIRNILVARESKGYELLKSIEGRASLEKTFYANNYTFDVYSFKPTVNATKLCNYICVTGYYLCTNSSSPYDLLKE